MSNPFGTRHLPQSTLRVGVIVAAIVLAFPVPPADATSDVFATSRKSGSVVSGEPIVELGVPVGKYAFLAKINLDQDSKSFVTVECTLSMAGIPLDRNVIRLQPSGLKSVDNLAMPFQAVEELATNVTIHLTCTFPPEDSSQLSFRFAKITAMRLDGKFCEKPTPAICPGPTSD
jgi:hypothetical protein